MDQAELVEQDRRIEQAERYCAACERLTRCLPYLGLTVLLVVALFILSLNLFLDSMEQFGGWGRLVHSAIFGAEGGTAESNPLRNVLELGSFLAAILVPFIAIVAGVFAYRQVIEASRARKAATYIEIADRWQSEEVVKSRQHIIGLREEFKSDLIHNPIKARVVAYGGSVQDYIRESLEDLRSRDRIEHSRMTFILQAMENVGILFKKTNVDAEEICELISGQVVVQWELLEGYTAAMRAQNSLIFRNAMDLYTVAKPHYTSGLVRSETQKR